MAQIFHRSANTLSRVTIFGAVFIAGFLLWVIGGIVVFVVRLVPRTPESQRRGGAERRVPGGPEAEELGDQGVVVRVPGRRVDGFGSR